MPDFNAYSSSTYPLGEKEYWNKIKGGDKAGLEGLYTLFIHEMMAFGLSIVSDRSLVKDCIQELFIEIWRYRKNGNEVKNVKTYVFRSLANKINKEITKEKKRHAKEQAEGFQALYFRNDAEVGVINLQEEETANKRLLDALEKLPSRQRQVLGYVFFESLSNDQISKLMGINVQSVYTLTWKAICNLKKHYLVPLFLLVFP